MKCDHTMGIYYDGEETYLITIQTLENEINAIKRRNTFIRDAGDILKGLGYKKEYTLETYYKKTKKDNCFDVFNYCPDCGKSIKDIEKDLFKEEI